MLVIDCVAVGLLESQQHGAPARRRRSHGCRSAEGSSKPCWLGADRGAAAPSSCGASSCGVWPHTLVRAPLDGARDNQRRVIHNRGHLHFRGGPLSGHHIRGRSRLHIAAAGRHTGGRHLAACPAASRGTGPGAAQAAQRRRAATAGCKAAMVEQLAGRGRRF